VTQLALLDKLADFDNVELFAPVSIKTIKYSPSACTSIELADGVSLQAKVLVAADGGNSRVRQTVGLDVTS